MKNHPRKKKPDGLLEPDMRQEEAETFGAVAPLDRLASAMDQKWGVDRLVELVSPETARKYGSALGRLNEAVRAHDAKQAAHMAAVCMRGLKAMDQEATEAGQTPSPLLAEFKEGPVHFGIMADNADWKPIKAARPELTLYSLREVAIAIQGQHGDARVQSIKQAFPGAEIGKPKSKPLPRSFWENGGDEIPL